MVLYLVKSGKECHLQYLIAFALLVVPASLLIQLTVLLQHSPAIDASVRFLILEKDASPDALHCASQLSSKPLKKPTPFTLAILCCSPPLSFMPDMKLNPDATEVI